MGPDKAGVQLDVSSGSGVSGDGRDEVCQVSGGRGQGSQVCSAATLCMLRLSLYASVSTRLFPLPVDEN